MLMNTLHSKVPARLLFPDASGLGRMRAGFFMKRNLLSRLLLFVGALSFAACSGPPGGWNGGGGGGGGGGTSTVSFTLVADTFPANPSLLSYTVTVNEITLTPAGGTAVTLTPTNPLTVDLVRLQSDSAFLGTLTGVPAGAYTVTASLSAVGITFFNDTASTIIAGGTTCPSLAVCGAFLSASGTPQVASFTFTATAGGKQGIGLDFNLNSSLTLAGGTLTPSFGASVLSAFTLPRQNSNLATNQLDLIEDYVGVVSLTQAGSVTITQVGGNSITAQTTSTTAYDPDPTGTLCPSGTTSLSTCVGSNQLASMDAILNSDGTFSVLEIEPLDSTVQDIVEGTIVKINSSTQFAMVATNIIEAPTGSLISSLSIGDPLTVNIPTPNPFLVDTKGLDVVGSSAASLGTFQGQTTTAAMFPGQTVAVNVTNFTAQSGTTPAIATANTVTLRFSRFTASVAPLTTTTFDVAGLPTYFNFTSSSTFLVQAFVNTTRNTNLDGLSDLTTLSSSKPVALRALFFENPQLTLTPAFFAAKVRQH
jgi:Domain of unknown function (DUF4382)